MIEEFKHIEGYKNKYIISNFGRVVRVFKNGRMIELKQYEQWNDYLVVHLWDGKSNRKKYRVHRLVALHFIPNDDEEKDTIHHIDGNRKNNHVNNLKWESFINNLRERNFSRGKK